MGIKENKIYPSEFEYFFRAMIKEMERHRKKKGDSWKKETVVVGRMYPTHADYNEGNSVPVIKPMDEYLSELLKKAIADYFKTNEPHQLVDIADICGMIWCRNTITQVDLKKAYEELYWANSGCR